MYNRPTLRGMLFIVFATITCLMDAAHAAGFEATLEISDGHATQSARSATTAPSDPLAHRVVLESSAANSFTAKWKITRTAKQESKDALVHFYVVKTTRQGEAPPPLEPGKVVLESALTMDFVQGKTSSAIQQFRVDGPGVYLARIEAGADEDKAGSGDFAEIELVIK